MPIFIYKGRDTKGILVNGKRMAQAADTLSLQLIQEGITPIKILAEEDSKSDWQKIKEEFFYRKVSTEELAVFARQMYTLVSTGVPISTSLRHLADTMRNTNLATILYGVVEHLEAGQDMATAMQNYPKIFSPLMISMVRVGQSSGHIADAFMRINQYLELETSAAKDIKTALRYPFFVMIAMVIAVVLINVFVIPSFAKVFAQAKVELPWATRFFIGMSNFFVHDWIILLIGAASAIWGFYYYISTISGRLAWDKFLLHVPIIGKVLNGIMLLRFSQSFAITLNSGIPLIEGIELIAQSVNNEYAKKRILMMREAIERGNNLAQAAAITNLFSPLELQILSISEETGELGPMLDQIAMFYKREVDYDLKRLGDTIEPILIIFIAGLILILAFAVYLPIWDLASVAKKAG